MAAKKGQEVPIDIAQINLYWTCPNPECNKENHEDSNRNGHVSQLECEACKTVIIKQRDALWVVE
jgi:hypothetical protein